MAYAVKTRIELPHLDKADGSKAILTLRTDKASGGGIYCHAGVSFEKDGLMTFEVFGDYSSHRARNREARATQKAIVTLHQTTFTPAEIAAITDAVNAHYAAKAVRDGK